MTIKKLVRGSLQKLKEVTKQIYSKSVPAALLLSMLYWPGQVGATNGSKNGEVYKKRVDVSYFGNNNFDGDWNHGFSIGGATPVNGSTLGLRFSNVFSKDMDSISGKISVPNNLEWKVLFLVPYNISNTYFSIDYSNSGDKTGRSSMTEPVDIDGDGLTDVDIGTITETSEKKEKMKFNIMTNISLKDFLIRLYGGYGTKESDVRQAMSVFAGEPLNIEDAFSVDLTESRKSHSLLLMPKALTPAVNFGILLGLQGNNYKFSFDNKIENLTNKQYSAGLTLDKEIGRGRFDLAVIADFIENYPKIVEQMPEFHKKSWQAHLLGGYAFSKYPIALLGHLNADGLSTKSETYWQERPQFGGGATILLTKAGKSINVLNAYLDANQASLYEQHANNFLEVPKETNYLLAYVPSDELLTLYFNMLREGSKGTVSFGAAGNPLPYLRLFFDYQTGNNNPAKKRNSEFTLGGSYLF